MITFWIDLIAYGATAVISVALMFIVLGSSVRSRINWIFSLLMLIIAAWSVSAVILRITLWRVTQVTGVHQFWMEIGTLMFMFIAPVLLVFSAAYTQTRARWPYVLALAVGLAIGLFALPLFRHQIVFNVRLGPDGTIFWKRTPLSFFTSVPLIVGAVLALYLLWREWPRTREVVLPVAVSILFLTGTVFSLISLPFPTMSLSTLIVVGIMGYAVLNRQLFGPLRALTRELEQRVEERTRQLQEVAAQLEEANRNLSRQMAQMEAASVVAREAATIRDIQTLLDQTVRLISERFGFYHAGIFLIDEAGKYAILRAASSEGGQRMLARGHQLAVGEVGIVGYVAGTGKPRIALDVGEDAVFFDNPDLPETHSEMALPLKVGERVIGVLDVQSTEPAAFTEEDITILQTMADQIALAIENTRLLAEAQDRLREVTTLTREYARREWEQLVSERPGWGYIYDGVEVRPVKPASDSLGGQSAFTLPLQVPEGETIGRISVALPDRAPTSEEIALAQAAAEQAALALESARLFQQTQRTLREMETLYRASQAISAAQTPDEVLRAFVDHVIPSQINRCVVALFDPSSLPETPVVEVVAAWEQGVERSPSLGRRWSAAQIPFIAQMVREPVAISDVETYPDVDETSRYIFRHVLGVRAVLSIPLLIGEQLRGWLMVESLREPYEFTEQEIRLYRTLADQAAQALERMRLFEETQRRAEWERVRAEIAARVRASTDIDTILRTAVRELGRAFRATEGTIQLHTGDGR